MTTKTLDSVVSSNSQELSSASSAIKLFENPLFKARVIMRCSEPWFVAKDVATCIEHSNVSKMCELCRDKDKIVVRPSDLTSNDLLDVKNREYNLHFRVWTLSHSCQMQPTEMRTVRVMGFRRSFSVHPKDWELFSSTDDTCNTKNFARSTQGVC